MLTSEARPPVVSAVWQFVLRTQGLMHRACSSRLRHTALSRVGTRLPQIVVLLAACGDPPAERREVAPNTDEAHAGVVDWNRRAISLESRDWSIEFCEGEGPFLCVAREGGQAGSVELFRIAVQDHAAIAEVLGRGGSELEALKVAAGAFIAALSADRSLGFGEDYQLRAEPTMPTTVMGEPGLRVVVEGRHGDRVLERIVHYYSIQRDTFYLLAATGTESGGPLGEFTTEGMKTFEPLFSEIASASRVDANIP